MKYLKFTLIILVAIFLLYYYFSVSDAGKQQLKGSRQIESVSSSEQKQWETKTDEQSPVTVAVTPIEFGKDAGTWKFDIVFDTHSGNLDENPLEIALLLDDKSNTYQPLAWEGPGPGGHHREGVLIFNPIRPAPPYVELKVKDVGGISERSFKWSVE